MNGLHIGNFKFVVSIDDFNPLNIGMAMRLKKIGMPATFFIETREKEAKEQIGVLSKLGFDIGGHTISHPPDIKLLPEVEQLGEIEGCKAAIESITGKPCEVFAYPRGRFSPFTIDAVIRSGFKEARTTHVLCLEYVDPHRMPTTVHANDIRREYEGKTWLEVANQFLEKAKREGGIFHLWAHALELDRDGQMGMFFNFIEGVIGSENHDTQ